MADDNIDIAVSDNGTINEIVSLLQLLGLSGEEASARVASGFTNLSASMAVAEASTRAMGAAANAGFTATDALGNAIDRLTTAEQKAATTTDARVRLTQLLATAQNEGYEAAVKLAGAAEGTVSTADAAVAAMGKQADATQTLTRLQVNLAALSEEQNAKYLIAIASENDYITAQNNAAAATAKSTVAYEDAFTALANYEKQLLAANISIQGLAGTYSGFDTLFAAQAAELAHATEATRAYDAAVEQLTAHLGGSFTALADAANARAAANERLSATETELSGVERAAAASIEEFIALQRECNTTTITGRAATEQATAAYRAARDAIGAYAVELELLASDQGKLADSAIAMANGINKADAALLKAEASMAVTGTEARTLAADVAALGEAGATVGKTFGGLNAIFAGAFAGNELIKASDEFTKIQASLATVTHGAADLANTYKDLLGVSNQTQTSLEQNAKFYVQVSDALNNAGVKGQDLIKVVGGIDTALKLGNVTGQDAYRVLRSISEIYNTTDGSAHRFLQNLQRESPAAFTLVTNAAKELGIDLKEFGSATESAGGHIDSLQQKLTDLKAKQDGNGQSVSSLTNKYNEAASTYTKSNTAIDKLSEAHGKNAAAVAANNDKLLTAIDKNTSAGNAMATYAGKVNIAKDAEQARLATQIKATEAEIASATAASNSAQKLTDLDRIFTQIYVTQGPLAQSFTTVSGTLTVLKNNLIDMAGSSSTASLSMTVLKDVINLVATNLDIVVPAVILFAASIITVKAAQVAVDIANLADKALTLGKNFVTTNLVIIGMTVAVGVLIKVFESLANVFLPANQQLDTFRDLGRIASAVGDQLATSFQAVSDKLTQSSIHAQAHNSALIALSGTTADNTKALGDQYQAQVLVDGKLVTLKANTDTTRASVGSLTQGVRDNTTAYAISTDQIEANRAKQAALTAGQADAKKAQDDLNTSVQNAPSLWQKLSDAISGTIAKLADYVSAAAKAAASALGFGGGSTPAPTTAGIGHAREGGTFAVAGTGPVDSKLIAVSPGEIVTVQTPAQAKAGVLPPSKAGQTHFATGGVTTGFGVSLGTGASLSAGSLIPGSVPSSVTGFSPGNSGTQGLQTAVTANASATATNTAATSTETSATATNSSAVTANTSALARVTNTITGNSSAITNAASTYTSSAQAIGQSNTALAGVYKQETSAAVTAANDNSRQVTLNSTALQNNGQTVVNAANAIVTADNSLGQTMASSANAISSAANAIVSAIQSAASASTSSVSSSTSTPTVTSTSSTNTSSDDPYTTQAQNDGVTPIYGATHGLLGNTRGPVIGYRDAKTGVLLSGSDGSNTLTANGTVSNSTARLQGSATSTGSSDANSLSQYKASVSAEGYGLKQQSDDIKSSLAGFTATLPGGAYRLNPTTGETISSAAYEAEKTEYARDGADFFVPGGTGVDSRIIKLAVSPGETVGVRTPAQQNASNGNDSNNTVIMNIMTPDANSFGQSQGQLNTQMLRGLRRASRRR